MSESYAIFEEGTLPSLGKIYTDNSVNPEFKIRSMTTEEEMRRLSHSDRPLKTVCDIIDSCLIDKPFGISSYDMCLGDYQYLLHKLRVATYGNQYTMEAYCPICGSRVEKRFDLDSMEILPYPNNIEEMMEFTLPITKKTVRLKMQTPRMIDNTEIRKKEFLKKAPKANDPSLLYSLCSLIDTIDGEKLDTIQMENFLRKLPMADTNRITKKANKLVNSIGLNLNIEMDCEVCGNTFHTPFRVTPEFYGPEDDE